MDMTTFADTMRSLWLVWLVVVFMGIAFWAYRPGNKDRFEEDANMIFDDEKNGGHHG